MINSKENTIAILCLKNTVLALPYLAF